jgi:hypothetical protein
VTSSRPSTLMMARIVAIGCRMIASKIWRIIFMPPQFARRHDRPCA